MMGTLKRQWICALGLLAAPVWAALASDAPELLFRVSADQRFTAEVARGDAEPNFKDKVRIVPTGAQGGAIEWSDDGVLGWNAPGNIYAQRGTLAFFWRPRYPVGEAPFVIFRVGYADHTSWDMAWLRIDWNGRGFDAFVTDANLARTRVSFALDAPPAADAWTHLAFAWDETVGVRLYVNGREVGRRDARADYDAGLDQLGLAARILSPHQVQSRYNFLRGSDVDEIRVYDRMLDNAGVDALAHQREPKSAIPSADAHRAWLHRYGFADPEGAVNVGLLLPQPRPDRFKVIAYNLGKTAQRATMTGWNVTAGRWRMRQGVDTRGDDIPDRNVAERRIDFEKSAAVDVVFPPRSAYIIELELEQAGATVELRPDLGIGRNDVKVLSDTVELTVHSLGHAATPPGIAILEDARGRELARTSVSPLPAPSDLVPKNATVRLPLSSGAARVRVMLEGDEAEVTRLNNRVDLPSDPRSP